MPNYYSYFFTRQDISPEQQLVQTAHAALKLGVNSQRPMNLDDSGPPMPFLAGAGLDPDETYFTVVGVRNEEALYAVKTLLENFGYRYEMFFEPDLEDSMTSIAVYPIVEYNRGPLLAFNLLKLSKN